MMRMLVMLGLLALSIAAPGAHAQAPANAIDPASIQALRDMGTFLQSLKRFQVITEATGERVLADGQKLQHSATARMDVERPNRLRAVIHSARFPIGKSSTMAARSRFIRPHRCTTRRWRLPGRSAS